MDQKITTLQEDQSFWSVVPAGRRRLARRAENTKENTSQTRFSKEGGGVVLGEQLVGEGVGEGERGGGGKEEQEEERRRKRRNRRRREGGRTEEEEEREERAVEK